MFLYTNNYKSEILTKSEPLEENYYASITSAQLTFCELMTECTVKYYRDLYHANKDPKIVTEANEGFFSKILGYLKKFRDMIVGFFRKWYKKLKEFIFGKKEKYTYQAIKELLASDKAAKLANFTMTLNKPTYLFNPLFTMLAGGFGAQLAYGADPVSFITSKDLVRGKDINIFNNGIGVDKVRDTWQGQPFMHISITEIGWMVENIEKLEPSVAKLESDVNSYLDKLNSSVTAWINDKKSTYTPQIGAKITAYTTAIQNFLKEAFAVSSFVPSIYEKIFARYLTESEKYLIEG